MLNELVAWLIKYSARTHHWVLVCATLSIDSKTTTKKFLDKRIRYKLIDSEGQQTKEFIRRGKQPLPLVYYDIADFVVIVYDVTDKDSFSDVETWLSSAKSHKRQGLFLVGNKSDKVKERVVAKKLAAQYAHSKGMHYQEVSVKESVMTNEVLEKITFLALGKGKKVGKVASRQEKVCAECSII